MTVKCFMQLEASWYLQGQSTEHRDKTEQTLYYIGVSENRSKIRANLAEMLRQPEAEP